MYHLYAARRPFATPVQCLCSTTGTLKGQKARVPKATPPSLALFHLRNLSAFADGPFAGRMVRPPSHTRLIITCCISQAGQCLAECKHQSSSYIHSGVSRSPQTLNCMRHPTQAHPTRRSAPLQTTTDYCLQESQGQLDPTCDLTPQMRTHKCPWHQRGQTCTASCPFKGPGRSTALHMSCALGCLWP